MKYFVKFSLHFKFILSGFFFLFDIDRILRNNEISSLLPLIVLRNFKALQVL